MFNIILMLVAAYVVTESKTDVQRIIGGAVLSAAVSNAMKQANV